ncbi:alanine/glycine:cation symporter family protein [Algivirga pacifica]|uniref:Alanine/glycine:cation symporter family protein n=1 Tax=Algivirga pacifica TaxID=1162670 RepID=A0ABP9CYQ3_9BACT
MELLENLVNSLNGIASYILIILLLCAGVFFTYRNKLVQFRMVPDMFKLLLEGSGHKHGVSSFQAFCISTASRVGTGNMAGVAIAVIMGGPGAVFWMWLIALIGSASAFVESTLAQIYKEKAPNADAFVGGPAYYMEKALGNRGLGVVFSVLITICFGFVFNAVQSNTIAGAMAEAFQFDPLWVGVSLAVVTGLVIFGGVSRIAVISEVIVPIMAVAYILVVSYVLVLNFTKIPSVIAEIIGGAFGFQQAAGGAIGAALMNGIKRGLFSNEAGMGSAPNAAATANVSHPVKQGLIQTLGVFTDTLLICSASAFLILISGEHLNGEGKEGIALTQSALSSQVGEWGNVFLAVSVMLFAFSSVVGNYYYGESNIEFISKKKLYRYIYRAMVLGMVVFGALAKVELVWNLADLFMALMAMTNIYAILKLSPIVAYAFRDYMEQKKKGIDPVFNPKHIGVMKGAETWKEEWGDEIKGKR